MNISDATRRVGAGTGGTGCDSGGWSAGSSWYRFVDGAFAFIPETAPSGTDQCGTQAPGWLSGGAHPTRTQGVVARTSCFLWSGNACMWSSGVRVVQCSGFFAYSFDDLAVCNLRICTTAAVPAALGT